MGDFSSSSSLLPSPLSRRHRRTDVGLVSRPRTPTAPPISSHARPHRRSSSDAGSKARMPSSSNLGEISSRTSSRVRQGHAPPVTAQTPPSTSKVRSYSAVCNEISPVLRLTRPTPAIHAHQSRHASNGCTTQLSPPLVAQVPISLNLPPSLSSSLTSPAPSLPTPPTPQSHRFPLHPRRRSAFITPSPSVSSFRSHTRSCEGAKVRCEPSPSPLSHAAREARRSSHRSSLASPPHLFIKPGLIPLRARPTLAMSMQIHAPTPVLSTRPNPPPLSSTARGRSRSRAGSTSRPSSPLTSTVPLPQRPPMPRPPSRSERLLRDTLRRAEEQERLMYPAPSLFGLAPPSSNIPPAVAQMFGPCRLPATVSGGRRHRRNTSSSVQSDSSCDHFDGEVVDEESPEDEEDNEWLWRANTTVSSSSAAQRCGNAYNPVRIVSGNKAESIPYGTPTSPSPVRVPLHRAAKSSPSVPRRHSHSHSQSVSHVAGHPPSKAAIDADRSGRTVTPHEAVLRSKLEGVLKNAKAQDRRTRSAERRDLDSGFSSGSGDSMASSRNRSGEGDFFFGVGGDSSLTSLSSNEPAKYRSGLSIPSSPGVPARHLHMPPPASPKSTRRPLSSQRYSPSSGVAPLTPPPSPPFNARQAAAQCKTMDGYISFANIEGLGVPDDSDDETDEDAKSRSRWFQWLHISGKTATNDRVRGRSDSSSASR
ncbi:hypothetical protein LXA43DRAFT_884185 [Ganoderma leucocontextum]|nr:hypothetical protein LXA43DRAFT_884185 [Ganoderma leucocontextum]